MTRRPGHVAAPRRAPAAPASERGPGRFLYARVARDLRRRILGRLYPPGTRIPTEAELVREFGVSAITVRRAIRDLAAEGLVVGRQGLGVFVTGSRRIVRTFGADFRATIADEIRRSGVEPGVKERSLALVPADDATAARLGVRPGSNVYRHQKVFLADGEPIGTDTTYLPRRLGDAVRQRLAEEFTLDVLREQGVAMDHIDYEFQGGVVSDEDAGTLGLPAGFPLLVVNYTVVGPDGNTVVSGRNASRADRFTYQFCGRPAVHQPRLRRAPGRSPGAGIRPP